MKLEQSHWTRSTGWNRTPGDLTDAQLVLAFGGGAVLRDEACIDELRSVYPNAYVVGCSTAGEICDVRVFDDSLVATAVHLESSRVVGRQLAFEDADDSARAGERLAAEFDPVGLRHLFVLSEGLEVNGTELVKGLQSALPDDVVVTGGLSGDGPRFEETLVVADGAARRNLIAGVGFYGERLRVGYASLGGWDSFGPERFVTRAEGNVLFELDGRSALSLYKEYLGDAAADLPASGLLFPLGLRIEGSDQPLVRTILGIDEDKQSMTFAGDIPEGCYARLMKANFNRLVDGAMDAAKASHGALDGVAPDLSILISCVGRKMVLKQRTEEEVEAVRDVVGPESTLTGFYSYGEISPFTPNARCELHNQTMTITTFSEV